MFGPECLNEKHRKSRSNSFSSSLLNPYATLVPTQVHIEKIQGLSAKTRAAQTSIRSLVPERWLQLLILIG